MRRELLFAAAALAALIVGAVCAPAYARLAVPWYGMLARVLATGHPWKIRQLLVVRDPDNGTVLRLRAEVRRHRGDPQPAALVESSVQVGEVIETPLVFWSLVLFWPLRRRWRSLPWRLAVALPVFAGLELLTTGVQLVHPLAQAAAFLAGEAQPLTLWERWARFLEGGGRFALEAAGALLAVAATGRSGVPGGRRAVPFPPDRLAGAGQDPSTGDPC